MPPAQLSPSMRSPRRRLAALLACALCALLALGCGGMSISAGLGDNAMSGNIPRWICPTPTALPTIQVEDGTETNVLGTPETQYRDTEPYEREYGIGNRPAPRPTPFGKGSGFQATNAFYLGQIVNWVDLDMQLSVAGSAPLTAAPDQRVYTILIRWNNRGGGGRFEPARQVAITAIGRADGRQTAGMWMYNSAAGDAAGIDPSRLRPGTIPDGQSELRIPIIAPDGDVASVDLLLDQQGTSTGGDLRFHFTPGRVADCSADGTWNAVYAYPARTYTGVAAPAGADAVVAAALRYVGRQYCWGGKGYAPCDGFGGGSRQVTPGCADYPCFDCSGLTWFAYKESGWAIGQGTENQKKYQPVPASEVRPGDLMLFSAINANGRGARITHVGIYAGDLDGDGTGDLIHAANYPTGVVITKNVFGNPYYRDRLVVITRPPRGGGV